MTGLGEMVAATVMQKFYPVYKYKIKGTSSNYTFFANRNQSVPCLSNIQIKKSPAITL
jgi:hypothetical protein